MLPKFRSFVRPIVRLFVHSSYSSFIVRSSSLFIVRSYDYSPLLFIIVTIHRHYSASLLFIVTIHQHYSSLLQFVVTIHWWYLWYLFRHHYSSLLFIDHLITPNFNYSSIMLSSPPKTSQTYIPVILTPVTVIFLPVGNFPSGHPSQVSPSWARLTLRFLQTRLPNSDSNNSCF
jgi:hypothetical protein